MVNQFCYKKINTSDLIVYVGHPSYRMSQMASCYIFTAFLKLSQKEHFEDISWIKLFFWLVTALHEKKLKPGPRHAPAKINLAFLTKIF